MRLLMNHAATNSYVMFKKRVSKTSKAKKRIGSEDDVQDQEEPVQVIKRRTSFIRQKRPTAGAEWQGVGTRKAGLQNVDQQSDREDRTILHGTEPLNDDSLQQPWPQQGLQEVLATQQETDAEQDFINLDLSDKHDLVDVPMDEDSEHNNADDGISQASRKRKKIQEAINMLSESEGSDEEAWELHQIRTAGGNLSQRAILKNQAIEFQSVAGVEEIKSSIEERINGLETEKANLLAILESRASELINLRQKEADLQARLQAWAKRIDSSLT